MNKYQGPVTTRHQEDGKVSLVAVNGIHIADISNLSVGDVEFIVFMINAGMLALAGQQPAQDPGIGRVIKDLADAMQNRFKDMTERIDRVAEFAGRVNLNLATVTDRVEEVDAGWQAASQALSESIDQIPLALNAANEDAIAGQIHSQIGAHLIGSLEEGTEFRQKLDEIVSQHIEDTIEDTFEDSAFTGYVLSALEESDQRFPAMVRAALRKVLKDL